MDDDPLRNSVVLITGCASGIGYATVLHLIKRGCFVVAGDINEPSSSSPEFLLPSSSIVKPSEDRPLFTFRKTDVCDWEQLKQLFKTAITVHGRVDHVFANAGISSTSTWMTGEEELDEDGDPKNPPDHGVVKVNLLGVMDTVKLALHFLRKQETKKQGDEEDGGEKSIVVTASCSAFQRFSLPEYTASKHGVLGLMRSLHNQLLSPDHQHPQKIRINAISPSWTITGLIPRELADKADDEGFPVQEAEAVARSVGMLMQDEKRHGQLLYSCRGEVTEIEGDLMDAAERIVGATKGTKEGDGRLDEQMAVLAGVALKGMMVG